MHTEKSKVLNIAGLNHRQFAEVMIGLLKNFLKLSRKCSKSEPTRWKINYTKWVKHYKRAFMTYNISFKKNGKSCKSLMLR